MERTLNLIKNYQKIIEKRIFPRFPFSYLTFKSKEHDDKHAFEVKDISYNGMQLSLKDGGHTYRVGDKVTGELHWKGLSLKVEGKVKWIGGPNFGVAFLKTKKFQDKIHQFFSIDNIIASMRPIHQSDVSVEFPTSLRYWLRADGQVEVFVWQHNDHEFSRFELIFLRCFVEWEDGKGLKTGRIITCRDIDTPLSTEDEFEFEIDDELDDEKIEFALEIIKKIPLKFISEDALEFLCFKLSGKYK